MNKKGRVSWTPFVIIYFIFMTAFLIGFIVAFNNVQERCEVICDINNEATTSLNMCVDLVNELADADINSNFTRLNCKEICGR